MKRILISLISIALLAGCGSEDTKKNDVSNDSRIAETKEERIEEIAQMEAEVKRLAKSDRSEMMDAKADMLLKRYRDFITMNPRDSISAEYLYKAADLSVGMGKYEGAIRYIERLHQDFPDFRKTVEMWLFKGFIYEVHLNDYARAVSTYQELVNRYPNHRLAEDARASIENLSLSEEELIEKFKRQNAEK